MPAFTSSSGVVLELDRRYYAEFKRQCRAASTKLEDHSADMRRVMNAALMPLEAAWRVRLPGSLKGTVKRLPASLTVRAGFPSPHGDHPFLPWLEFGGTVKWYGHKHDEAGYSRAPVPPHRNVHPSSGNVSSRHFMFLDRGRVPKGRYRQPAIEAAMPRVTQKVADGIVDILQRVFGASL